MAIGNIIEKQVNFLTGDDITDVVSRAEPREGQANHPIVHNRRPAAITRIDCGIYLDPQSRRWKIVRSEFDPRHNAFSDGKRAAAFWIAVRHDDIGDGWQ